MLLPLSGREGLNISWMPVIEMLPVAFFIDCVALGLVAAHAFGIHRREHWHTVVHVNRKQ